jgi:hypothetical protein
MVRIGTRRGGVLAGCLVALAVVGVLVAAGVIYASMHWRGWAGAGMRNVVTKAVEAASLPEQEKAEIVAVVDGFVADFERGDVTLEQLTKVGEEVAKSPLMPAMVIGGVNHEYIAGSDLPEEEKAAGSESLSRFVRGVFEGTISQTRIDDVTEPIHAPPGSSNKVSINAGNLSVQLKASEDVTTEELRAFLANAKAEADAAGVPEGRFEIDWSEELRLAIDRALGRASEVPGAEGAAAEEESPEEALEEDGSPAGGG